MSYTHKETNTLFTLYELEKLREYFPDLMPVLDGVVKAHQNVWWCSEIGPQKVIVQSHKQNIINFPECYSIAEPKCTAITTTAYRYED